MYPQIPVIRNKDYHVFVEPHADVLWIHCNVSHFSTSILKDMIKSWKEFTFSLQQDLYVLRDPTKELPTVSFISYFGFVFNKSIVNKDNISYEIWKRGA